ncbi:MAG: ribbon-helix-helix domain-containing protein [Bacteroidetes bacterium]|nr:MAG: ribbon-helix-helix domain-containing protein [Bacteroidota bacterium]
MSDTTTAITVRLRSDLVDRLRAVSRQTGVRIYRLVEIALEKELNHGDISHHNRRRRSGRSHGSS